MRLLFVDDEERILAGIENALIFAPDGWTAEFASSAAVAIEMLAASPYDVIVTDMKMPGLTGADMLEHVSENYPEIVRLVLSGEIDPVLAERAMPLIHEFLWKPCDPEDLFETIERVHANMVTLEREVFGSLGGLPSRPRLHMSIQAAINEGAGASVITELLSTDVAAAAVISKAANSALYGFSSPATDLRQSVARLGVEAVSGMVLATELASEAHPALEDIVTKINHHAALTAEVIRQIMGSVPGATLAGLLHDIGFVVLASRFPTEVREIFTALGAGENSTKDLEIEKFGVTHSEVGAYLLRMWKINDLAIEVVTHHHNAPTAPVAVREVAEIVAASEIVFRELEDGAHTITPEIVASVQTLVETTRCGA